MSTGRTAKDLFVEAVELPGAERGAFLERECAGDAALRERVERLLAAHEGGGEFMGRPSGGGAEAGAAGHSTVAAKLREGPGTKIGAYKLLQQIGEGGFGVVFMAEQEQPVRRRVALKIIKLGMDTRAVIARFEAERQALAMMDHPNIARVFDAGATETGRPYFVMELVKGVPITEYADTNNLNTRERLELFVPVCRAVQHAHQKGIIHRDIKPANVLVTLHDGEPVAKVIDFGIAKATDHRLTEKTVFTEFRQLIGTPEYMSPEQAEMSGLDVDTRSDVYSLGVLLYELLTGTTPFDSRELREKAYDQIQKMIREVDPPRPSVRISTLGETLTAVASHRKVEAGKLSRLVKGDLDWIVMRCLEKDRTRRYDTASDLAADVGRHLGGEAVEAAPPGVGYRVRKFVRRNRGVVGAGVAVGVTLLGGMGGTSWQAWLANKARAQVLEEKKRLVSNQHIAWDALVDIILLTKERELNGYVEAEPGSTARQQAEAWIRGHGAGWRDENPSGPSDVQLDIAQLALFGKEAAAKAAELNKSLEATNAQLRDEVKRARLAEADLVMERQLERGEEWITWPTVSDIRNAFQSRQEYLGPNDRATIVALFELGLELARPPHVADGLPNLREAVNRAEQCGGMGLVRLVDMLSEASAAHQEALEFEYAERTNAKIAELLERLSHRESDRRDLPITIRTEPGHSVQWGDTTDGPSAAELIELAKQFRERRGGELRRTAARALSRYSQNNSAQKPPSELSKELAMFHARQSVSADPDCGECATALAWAHYRISEFIEAKSELARAISLFSKEGRDAHPTTLACTAMTEFKLDHPDEARAALSRLTAASLEPKYNDEVWMKDLVSEAVKLIEGTTVPNGG